MFLGSKHKWLLLSGGRWEALSLVFVTESFSPELLHLTADKKRPLPFRESCNSHLPARLRTQWCSHLASRAVAQEPDQANILGSVLDHCSCETFVLLFQSEVIFPNYLAGQKLCTVLQKRSMLHTMKLLIPYFSKKNLVRQIVGFNFYYVTLTTCRLSMTNICRLFYFSAVSS